jgi:hypothetical protein
MSLLEEKAYDIFANAKNEDKMTVVIDPITIMAIISLITQVIKLYQSCQQTPAQAQAHMSGIGWWNRWKLSRMVNRTIPSDSSVSADDVYNALLNHSKGITVEDVAQLYNEVK